MNSTVLKEVIAFLFGRKYYANIIATKGKMRVNVFLMSVPPAQKMKP